MNITKMDFIKFSIFSIIILVLIIAWLGFGERGFIHLYRMEKERLAHIEIMQVLEEKNQALLDEIERLRVDKKYLESIVRSELGLVKDNEILYRFVRKGDKKPSASNEKK